MKYKIQKWGMMWLNMAGSAILIKALLLALPTYQYATILALASAHKQMELIITGFLWQGGKQENKKFSLLKWEQVTLPYEQGGLSIRLPGLMNVALGVKIIWRMIACKERWCKKTLAIKYMNQSRTKLLTQNTPIRSCTQVWKLVKKITPLIINHISKIPGNGKTISIWEDKIMGKEAIYLQSGLEDIQI